MISSRYASIVAFFLTLALIPTVIHDYLGATIDDGKISKRINQTLGDFISEPTDRKAEWVTGLFGNIDWIERIYKNPKGSKVRLFVGRTYDHKRLYHHPELALSHGHDFKDSGITNLSADSELPVHLLRSRVGTGLVAYALLYDGTFIKEPIAHQIFDSLNLLFQGKKQMTIFYMDDPKMSRTDTFSGSPAATILEEAIRSFSSQRPISQEK